jgi:hypothetical protein
MLKVLCRLVVLLSLAGLPASAGTTGDATYDLLFRSGTLDSLPRDHHLVYAREVTNALKPEAADRDTGLIELNFVEGTPEQALLKFRQDDKHRNLGRFPASVGNPIIMFFVETVVRDMAESAGGSPFYIRNRVKDALVSPADLEGGPVDHKGETVDAQAVTLRPFEDDPNAERMFGFDALELVVTMSDDVPGWYHSLEARVPGDDGAMIYSSKMVFEKTEVAE